MNPLPPIGEDAARALIARLAVLHHPLPPMPTGVPPRIQPIPGLRAVLFDVYGTLLCSASGDVDAADGYSEPQAMRAALDAADLAGLDLDPAALADQLQGEIGREHARLRTEGVVWPEVRIEECWARLLPPGTDPYRVAVEFEARMNPVWPLPGVRDALAAMQARGLLQGIISNAQFYTPLTLAAFEAFDWPAGWPQDLCVWSYHLRRGKPDPSLFLEMREALSARGLQPHEALFIGNDLIKDIRPAREAGFRTALYAGDARSLRLHGGQPGEADLVMTHWSQMAVVLPTGKANP
jgi:putative hydrolase of the HAD superfamily